MKLLESSDALTRVRLTGRLDTAGAGEIEFEFNEAVGPAGRNTILDFSRVTFLSSMGVRMLIAAARTLSTTGAKMVITAPGELVMESIEISGLVELIPVAADDAAARALLDG